MNRSTLDKILADHAAWLRGEGGKRAGLRRANLVGANLDGADLEGAYLEGGRWSRVATRAHAQRRNVGRGLAHLPQHARGRSRVHARASRGAGDVDE